MSVQHGAARLPAVTERAPKNQKQQQLPVRWLLVCTGVAGPTPARFPILSPRTVHSQGVDPGATFGPHRSTRLSFRTASSSSEDRRWSGAIASTGLLLGDREADSGGGGGGTEEAKSAAALSSSARERSRACRAESTPSEARARLLGPAAEAWGADGAGAGGGGASAAASLAASCCFCCCWSLQDMGVEWP